MAYMNKIIELHLKGMSYREIAEHPEVNVKKSQVGRIVNKYKAGKLDVQGTEKGTDGTEKIKSVKKTPTPPKPRKIKEVVKVKKIAPEDVVEFAVKIPKDSIHYKKAQALLKRTTHKYGTDGKARDQYVLNYIVMIVNALLQGKKPEELI